MNAVVKYSPPTQRELGITRSQARDAFLPENYKATVALIQKLERIDQTVEVVSQADAIASYYKQARDRTLLNAARRIQLRAMRRLGELINKTPFESGGMDPGTRKTAKRIANIQLDFFEEQVESDKPPSPQRIISSRPATDSEIAQRLESIPRAKRRQRAVEYFNYKVNAPRETFKTAFDIMRIDPAVYAGFQDKVSPLDPWLTFLEREQVLDSLRKLQIWVDDMIDSIEADGRKRQRKAFGAYKRGAA